MIKAFIFDFFGVIGQSTYAYIKDIYQPDKKQSLALRDLHRSFDYGFINNEDFNKQYADILKVSESDIKNIFIDANNHFSTSKLLLDFIDKNRSKYKMGLLSNVSGDAFSKFIDPITNHFDAVVTSYSVKFAKPDLEIYKIMADKLNLDTSECLMIDDSDLNCQGAIAAGMQALKYSSFSKFVKEINEYLT